MDNGLIQIYTGNGKGKTTAAVGQAIRAIGNGLRVTMVQFLKGSSSGETEFLKIFSDIITIYRFNSQEKFIWNMNNLEKELLCNETMLGFELASKIIREQLSDVLILDEVFGAITNGFLSVDKVIELLKSNENKTEIILTGRNADNRIIELADLVTEMKMVKHPFEKGINARKGIEY